MRLTTGIYGYVIPALGCDAADRMANALRAACTVVAPVVPTLLLETTVAALRIRERPVERVELRGLESLTPPHRHGG